MCLARQRWRFLGSGSVTRQWPNNEVMRSSVGPVARQRPVSNNGVVFFLWFVIEFPLPREHSSINAGLSC
jgi:hypothetical protein